MNRNLRRDPEAEDYMFTPFNLNDNRYAGALASTFPNGFMSGIDVEQEKDLRSILANVMDELDASTDIKLRVFDFVTSYLGTEDWYDLKLDIKCKVLLLTFSMPIFDGRLDEVRLYLYIFSVSLSVHSHLWPFVYFSVASRCLSTRHSIVPKLLSNFMPLLSAIKHSFWCPKYTTHVYSIIRAF